MQTYQIIDRFFEKARSRDCGNTDLADHPLAEFKICISAEHRLFKKLTDIDHDEICGLRNIML